MDQNMLNALKGEIDDIVDKWVSETLRERLISGTDTPQKRGLWDRLKQGISNWWYGPQGEKENPYRWKNRFGNSLGSEEMKESFDPTILTLSEYSDIRGVVDSVERAFDESQDSFANLKLAQILKAAAEELKVKIFGAVKNKLAAVNAQTKASPSENPTTNPSPAEPKKNEPENSPPQASGAATEPKTPKLRGVPRRAQGNAAASDKGSKSSATAPVPATPEKNDLGSAGNKEGDGQQSEPNESLMAYLQDERAGRRYDLDEAIKNIKGFLRSVERFRKNPDLGSWLANKAQGYIEKSTNEGESEARDQMWNDLVQTDLIVGEIEKITGVSKEELKRMMSDYIKNKGT